MLSDVKEYYGLARDLGQTGYFETAQSQQTFKELRLAIKEGKLVALSGIVGFWEDHDAAPYPGHPDRGEGNPGREVLGNRKEQNQSVDPDDGSVLRLGHR